MTTEVASASKRFYTKPSDASLGSKQSETPEGFLVLHDCPIARTGVQYYDASELQTDGEPIPAGPSGVLIVTRHPEDVFEAETVASANGKAVTIEHPEEDGERVFVTPENWKRFAVGEIYNARRGSGGQVDLLLADFIIRDKQAISDIRRGLREISAGYDSVFMPENGDGDDGRWKQTQIMINHAALVASGRCGPRCAVPDHIGHANVQELNTMATASAKKGPAAKLWDAITAAVNSGDKAKAEALITTGRTLVTDDEMPEPGGNEGHGNVHVHVGSGAGARAEDEGEAPAWFKEHADKFDAHVKDSADKFEGINKRFEEMTKKPGEGEGEKTKAEDEANKEIEGEFKEEAPPGTGERAVKATDSVLFEGSFTNVLAGAEILTPGIKLPIFDEKAKPLLTVKAICDLRRKSLEVASMNPDSKNFLDAVAGGRTLAFDSLSCSDIRILFNGTVALKRAHTAHQQSGSGTAVRTGDSAVVQRGSKTAHSTLELADHLDKLYGRTAA